MPENPSQGQVCLAYLIYALHAFSALTGLLTAAFVVTAFLTGWPSIIAVIINYVNRHSVRGTYLDSHFGWQIRTFWFAALWLLIAAVLFVTVILIPVAWIMVVFTGIWVLYRIIRGLLNLMKGRLMPVV